jgi:hemoglobin
MLGFEDADVSVSLFEKYGGFAKVSKIVMAFYDSLLDSDLLAEYFEGSDMRRLIDHQTKFIASLMGGPASYTNEALHQIHAHLDISPEAFEEMALTLEQTLEDFDFDPDDIAHIINEIRRREPFVVRHARS